MSAELTHQGRRVPWVTRWTNERPRGAGKIGVDHQGTFVYYPDGKEEREASGILWIREGIMRGGEPEYSQVSAFRQRACMRHRKCQVCGSKIEEPVIRWLLDERQILDRDGDTLTVSPPTCERCVDIAIRECPAMSKSHAIARVLEYEIWGVQGGVVHVGPDGVPKQVKANVEYGRTDYPFDYRAVVAYQQLVRWTKFVMEDR